MTEFDIPGLPALRGELSAMAARPGGGRRKSPLLAKIVREVYAELRAARIAAHGWGKLAATIKTHTKCPCSPKTVKEEFHRIDKEWERKTGVAALDDIPVKKGRPKKSGGEMKPLVDRLKKEAV